MRFDALILISLALLGSASAVEAQSGGCWAHWETLGGPYQDLHRSRDLVPAGTVRPTAVWRGGRSLLRGCPRPAADTSATSAGARQGPELVLLPAAALIQTNSAYARPGLDGLRWAGRGISSAAMAGAGVRWRF